MSVNVDDILSLVKQQPSLLQKTGRALNTWRLILGKSCIPEFEICYADILIDGRRIELNDFDEQFGYDEDGTPINITEVSSIFDIDANIHFNSQYYSDIKIFEDVVYYPNEYRYVTLAYLLNTETPSEMINSLPLFDHTQLIFNFGGKVATGVDNYPSILNSINYLNWKLIPNDNGMVKIAYNTEVPFTAFYNKKVNESLSKILPGIPLVRHCFITQLK